MHRIKVGIVLEEFSLNCFQTNAPGCKEVFSLSFFNQFKNSHVIYLEYCKSYIYIYIQNLNVRNFELLFSVWFWKVCFVDSLRNNLPTNFKQNWHSSYGYQDKKGKRGAKREQRSKWQLFILNLIVYNVFILNLCILIPVLEYSNREAKHKMSSLYLII